MEGVSEVPFGKTAQGEPVILYVLTNRLGMEAAFMNYGATLVRLRTPDRDGRMDDIVLGFDAFAPYPSQSPYFGATVGRYANRIAHARFILDGQSYPLSANDHGNSLHGGTAGFDKRLWNAEVPDPAHPLVRFSRTSPDGEEGYPGTLQAEVTVSLDDDTDILHFAYRATTDRPTIVNLTNHAYFNLAGAGNGTILDQVVRIPAEAYTPVDSSLISTGEIRPVAGTPMDFRHPTPIGQRLREVGGDPIGYDHNYVLGMKPFPDERLAAEVSDPKSGRWLQVYSDQPGIQFYSGNFLDGGLRGKGGKPYPQYGAFVLETQHFPDSPNHPDFPETVLRPGETYHTTTTWRFGAR